MFSELSHSSESTIVSVEVARRGRRALEARAPLRAADETHHSRGIDGPLARRPRPLEKLGRRCWLVSLQPTGDDFGSCAPMPVSGLSFEIVYQFPSFKLHAQLSGTEQVGGIHRL